jgi:hypothetical protein
VYIDGLLTALSNAGVGCYIGNNFVGALAYADDIVLLAPSASALRRMLAIAYVKTTLMSTQLRLTLVRLSGWSCYL